MTQEENDAIAEEIIRFQEENPDYWGDQEEWDEQEEYVVDMDRLRENLKLTPAERLRKMEQTVSLGLRHNSLRSEAKTAGVSATTREHDSGDSQVPH